MLLPLGGGNHWSGFPEWSLVSYGKSHVLGPLSPSVPGQIVTLLAAHPLFCDLRGAVVLTCREHLSSVPSKTELRQTLLGQPGGEPVGSPGTGDKGDKGVWGAGLGERL